MSYLLRFCAPCNWPFICPEFNVLHIRKRKKNFSFQLMSLLAGVQWCYVASALNELLCQAAKKNNFGMHSGYCCIGLILLTWTNNGVVMGETSLANNINSLDQNPS
jgi:hypothetical protein